VRFDEFLSDCTNMPPEPQQGSVDLALVRGQHSHHGVHDLQAYRNCPPFLPIGTGKLAQEVFIHLPEYVSCGTGIAAKTYG